MTSNTLQFEFYVLARKMAGLIGGDILRQFTLTFDPVQHVVYFRRSKSLGRRTGFDRPGMWVISKRPRFHRD